MPAIPAILELFNVNGNMYRVGYSINEGYLIEPVNNNVSLSASQEDGLRDSIRAIYLTNAIGSNSGLENYVIQAIEAASAMTFYRTALHTLGAALGGFLTGGLVGLVRGAITETANDIVSENNIETAILAAVGAEAVRELRLLHSHGFNIAATRANPFTIAEVQEAWSIFTNATKAASISINGLLEFSGANNSLWDDFTSFIDGAFSAVSAHIHRTTSLAHLRELADIASSIHDAEGLMSYLNSISNAFTNVVYVRYPSFDDLSDDLSDDYADNTHTSGTLHLGQAGHGRIERPHDHDWFRVHLTAGHHYRISLEGAPTHKGTLRDTYLYGLHDASGRLLPHTANDDSGGSLNSRVDFTPRSSGDYYVDAGAYGSYTGTYTVTVTDFF